MTIKKYSHEVREQIDSVLSTFANFKAPMKLVNAIEGRHVLTLHLQAERSVRMAEIESFQKDLAYALGIKGVEIEAPIPDEHLIGVHIPKRKPRVLEPQLVFESGEYENAPGDLVLPFGVSDYNEPVTANLCTMPHMLIGGSTGSGKSTFLHLLITSLMKRYTPEHVRLVLIDLKRVEFSLYDESPFLLTKSVNDPKRAVTALKWAVKEMERRYEVLNKAKVRDVSEYHKKRMDEDEALPYIVIVVDELADVMATYPQQIEVNIVRLCMTSRPVGIHLILSTQHPSVKVITGIMKANIPCRIAFKVPSMVDSRTILDDSGAEKLLGGGDALYKMGEMLRAERMQTPRTTTEMIRAIVKESCDRYGHGGEASDPAACDASESPRAFDDEYEECEQDQLLDAVKEYVVQEQKASTSLIQRRFKIGYGRAARIMDQLEEVGVVAPSDGSNKPREVLMTPDGHKVSEGTGGSNSDKKKQTILEKTLRHFTLRAQCTGLRHTKRIARFEFTFSTKKEAREALRLRSIFELALAISPIILDIDTKNGNRLFVTIPR